MLLAVIQIPVAEAAELCFLPLLLLAPASSPSPLPPASSSVPPPPAQGCHPTWWGQPIQPWAHCPLALPLTLQLVRLVPWPCGCDVIGLCWREHADVVQYCQAWLRGFEVRCSKAWGLLAGGRHSCWQIMHWNGNCVHYTYTLLKQYCNGPCPPLPVPRKSPLLPFSLSHALPKAPQRFTPCVQPSRPPNLQQALPTAPGNQPLLSGLLSVLMLPWCCTSS